MTVAIRTPAPRANSVPEDEETVWRASSLQLGDGLQTRFHPWRNDETLMIAGLHCAILMFHNRVVDRLRAEGEDHRLATAAAEAGAITESFEGDRRRGVFEQARRLVTWHYQWIVVHEFLPAIVGAPLVGGILSRGPRFYNPFEEPSIPVEFQAAYRFGHSLVRPFSWRSSSSFSQSARGFPSIQASRIFAQDPAPHLDRALVVDYPVANQSGQGQVQRVPRGA